MGDRKSDHLDLLSELFEAIARGDSITSYLSPGVDPDLVIAGLREIAESPSEFVWSAINESRVDVTVVSGMREWRVVFGTRDGRRVDWLGTYRRPPVFHGFDGGLLVLVNGPSGAGKSTVLRSLQEAHSAVPWVIFDEPEQVGNVKPEFLIWRDQAPALHRGYLMAIGAMTKAGNLVAAAAGGRPQSDFDEHVGQASVVRVGLYCAVEVLVERERGRTGRWGGIAEASADVHDGWRYDLTFDTSNSPDPSPIADEIAASVATNC